MKEEKFKRLTTEKLKEKVTGYKILIGVFTGIIAFYIYMLVSDYLSGKEMNWMFAAIIISSASVMFSVFPGLKAIKKELANR